tara:strand:- start:391 stop:2490 length:2100 start_codon:yes stop_codon:yes gene_type:complete
MADVVWQGSSSTAAGTAANWVGGSLPGSGDVVVFNSTADANCVWDASAIATVQGLRIESNFDAILQFNAAGSLNLTSAGLEIQAAGKISAAAAFTFAFSGALPFTGNIESYVKIDSSNDSNLDTGNTAYTGMFDSTATRGLFTFTFAIPTGVDVIMDDGVYPNLTLTSASGTVFFAMIYGVPFNNYGIVDVLNFSISSDVEARKASSTYYPVANDYLKRFVFNGTLTISSNYWYTYRSSVTYVPQSTATFRFPADGETNYGVGANFYAQHYDVVIAPGDVAGTKCILDSGHILSCNSIRVLEGGVFVGPPEEPGSEIRSIKRPVIDGTWNFVQVADGIYSSDDSKPFFGVPQGGTGLQTVTKGSILIGNDMNVLSTDSNLTFAADHLHVDRAIKITEGNDHPVSPGSGYGLLWVKDNSPSPNTLIFSDGAGTDTTLGSGGGGVTSVATSAPITGGTITGTGTIGISAATTSAAGSMSSADKTKLDGIEASADVTDATNVKSALDGMSITSVTPALNDEILIQDTDDSDNLKTATFSDVATTILTGAPGTGTMVTEFVGVPSGTPSINSATWTDVSLDGTPLVGSTSDVPNYAGGGTKKGYTIPADGLYYVEAAVGFSGWAGNDTTYYIARITQNSSGGSASLGATFSLTGNSDGGDINPVQYYLALSQNDQVGLAVYQNIGSTKTIYFAQLSIRRVFGV